jgi:hypothetical protein
MQFIPHSGYHERRLENRARSHGLARTADVGGTFIVRVRTPGSDAAPMGKLEVSQRRIDANRRNAALSTGPRTAEGKDKSRRNSLIHGLAGEGVVVPQQETEAARMRAEQWNSSLRPMNAFEVGLVETIAIESVRLDRCRIEEKLARDLRGREAGVCWADMRKAEVAKLGKTLSGQPDEVAPKLACTSAGCDWLIVRWFALGKNLIKNGAWTESQATMALDLMGVAADLRELDNPLETPQGVEPMAHLRAIVNHELDELHRRKHEALDAANDDRREAATLGLVAVDDPTLVLLRRYETASFRRMKWAIDLMKKGRSRPRDTGPTQRDFDPPAWRGQNPAAVTKFPTPRPAPVPPSPTIPPGPGGSPRPGSVPESGSTQPIDRSVNFQRLPHTNQTHLQGHLSRLASTLRTTKVPAYRTKDVSKLSSHRVGRLIRPAATTSRPMLAGQIHLMVTPAA